MKILSLIFMTFSLVAQVWIGVNNLDDVHLNLCIALLNIALIARNTEPEKGKAALRFIKQSAIKLFDLICKPVTL